MITDDQIMNFIENNIGYFHEARLKSLQSLKLERLLKRKNPYLFRCKNIQSPNALVKFILEAHLSSQEETIFGNFLERLAIFINEQVFNGTKSSAEGVDLEFRRNRVKYIVSIKSGPNWGNNSQIKRMIDNFNKAKRILKSGGSHIDHIIAVNGCCYGVDNNPDKGSYFKYCGQKFWEFISDDKNLYTRIIEPLGHKVKAYNEAFEEACKEVVDNLVDSFITDFCQSGEINWVSLVEYNSKANEALH